MYDPEGSDTNREWIEVVFDENEEINSSTLTLVENGREHELTLVQDSSTSFAIIAQNAEQFLNEYPSFTATLFDSSFSLRNSGQDYIALKNSVEILDFVNYSVDWGGRGRSLERLSIEQSANDPSNWQSSVQEQGTPGQANNLVQSCDWRISLTPSKDTYTLVEGTATLNWSIQLETSESGELASALYWIEGPSGEIIQEQTSVLASSSNQLDNFEKRVDRQGEYFLRANITDTSCNDGDLSNNFAEKLIIVEEAAPLLVSSSRIEIEKILPQTLNFGNSFNVTLNLYRGDTNRYALHTFVEDTANRKVSEDLSFHINEKFSNSSVILSILLPDNCERKYQEPYYLHVEGLNLTQLSELKISDASNSICNVEEETVQDSKKPSNEQILFFDAPSFANSGDSLDVQAHLQNGDKETTYHVWSYLIKGRTCYSCQNKKEERNANFITINLLAYDEKNLDFILPIDSESSEDEYTLVLEYLKNDQKTSKKITTPIQIKKKEEVVKEQSPLLLAASSHEEEKQMIESEIIPNSKNVKNTSHTLIYEGSSQKAARMIPFVLLLAFLLILIILLKKT